MTMQNACLKLMQLGMVLALISICVPMWWSKADTAMRRLFWIATVMTVVSFFIGVWPEWQAGLTFSAALGGLLLLVAFRFTSHLRFRGRIFALPGNRPDRPPSRHRRPEL